MHFDYVYYLSCRSNLYYLVLTHFFIIIEFLIGGVIMNQSLNFSKFSFRGSPYEIGYALGDLMLKNNQLREINVLPNELDSVKLKSKLDLIKQFCPNVIEEATGVTDKLKVQLGRLTIFNDDYLSIGACSQIAALPSITENGHLLVGRSYEWSPYDELNLIILKENNFPAQIGFSLFLFGRFDGINENGLTITMSSCEYGQPSFGYGIWFPLVLRIILDNCSTTDEAVYLLKQIPIRCSSNILIADQKGNAVIAEIACYGKDKKISFRRNEQLLISTNHYVNDDMICYDNHHGKHSEIRYKTIEHELTKSFGYVNECKIKELLSKKIPQGVCCHFYEDGLGTLRSLFFDVTDKRVDICFGSPNLYPFETVHFDNQTGFSLFSIEYINQYADNPNEFWQLLPKGGKN